MLLTVKKEVKETIEVAPPIWLHDNSIGRHYKITPDGGLVKVGNGYVSLYSAGGPYTQKEIEDAIADSKPCDEKDFEKALKTQIIIIENA